MPTSSPNSFCIENPFITTSFYHVDNIPNDFIKESEEIKDLNLKIKKISDKLPMSNKTLVDDLQHVFDVTVAKFGLPEDRFRQPSPMLCGIEYEVEGVRGVFLDTRQSPLVEELKLSQHCHVTSDNSLKWLGNEIITNPGTINEQQLIYKSLFLGVDGNRPTKPAISLFPPDLKTNPTYTNFSFRTSTHVHVNVLSLTEEQLKTLIYAYVILEPVFFNYVDPLRKSNIHCVPLADTSVLVNLKNRSVLKVAKMWHKYTAFNLLPIHKQGTIEFRHLQGVGLDPSLLRGWLRLIEMLYNLSLEPHFTSQTISDFLMSNTEPIFYFLDRHTNAVLRQYATPNDEPALQKASIPLRDLLLSVGNN